MSSTVAPLRADLDFLPSHLEDRPGLLIRDPFQFSDAVLIVPPPLVGVLQLFDGQRSMLEMKEILYRATNELESGEVLTHLYDTLSKAGFLDDENFAGMREARRQEFRDSPARFATHAGSAYPDTASELSATMDRYFAGPTGEAQEDGVVGIAAPHVSPEGGWESYRDAYRAIPAKANDDRVFVILGTSHYGAPEQFGLTRKSYVTPFGGARTETGMVDFLEKRAASAVVMEDYCHAVEHSIEFQVAFLQSRFGADVRVLPILCGPYAKSLYRGGRPEEDDRVKAFLDALGELNARERERLFWVLGVDMAHMGARYGDEFEAVAGTGAMQEAEARDRARIEQINSGDTRAYWELVQQNRDDLKWCGSAPFYTFLKAVPEARGHLRRYQQWNIDPQSVVSFAGMAFRR